MRRVTVSEGTYVPLRAGEIDWFPTTLMGYMSHLILNDEDFCGSKSEKLNLRRIKRRIKQGERSK